MGRAAPNATPDVKTTNLNKAELVERVVYAPSPDHLQQHGAPHLHLALRIDNYQAATPGTAAADNATVRLDADNQPQPDVPRPRNPRRSPARSLDSPATNGGLSSVFAAWQCDKWVAPIGNR